MDETIEAEAHVVVPRLSSLTHPPLPPWIASAPSLKVTKLDPKAITPKRSHSTDAGLDLAALNAVRVERGGVGTVYTGLAVAIPEGYAGLLYVRSSLGAQGVSLANSVGVIDSSYRGELVIKLVNNAYGAVTIRPTNRVAQLVITPVALPLVDVVDVLDETERGTGGFGSTGE